MYVLQSARGVLATLRPSASQLRNNCRLPPQQRTDRGRAVGELIDFRPRRKASGPRQIVDAVDDAIFDSLPAEHREPTLMNGLTALFVRSSSLGSNQTADLWIAPYEPSGPGRIHLFDTLASERFERDELGCIYRDGELLWECPPVAFGVPHQARYGRLAPGRKAALFFLASTVDGWTFRIRTTTTLILLVSEPVVMPGPVLPTMWLDLAARSLASATTGD